MNFKEALIAHLQGEKVEASIGDGWKPFMDIYGDTYLEYVDRSDAGEGDEFRLKPRTITVNGREVQAGETVAPEGEFFAPCLEEQDLYAVTTWGGTWLDITRLNRGLVHLTKDAAIAHAKAMLNID